MVGRWIKAHPVAFRGPLRLWRRPSAGWPPGGSIFGTGYAEAARLAGRDDAATRQLRGAEVPGQYACPRSAGSPAASSRPPWRSAPALGRISHLYFPARRSMPWFLLGMVSYFAGVVQAPITAFVIVTEMTDNHHMMVPLMAAAVIATRGPRASSRRSASITPWRGISCRRQSTPSAGNRDQMTGKIDRRFGGARHRAAAAQQAGCQLCALHPQRQSASS